MHVVMAVVLSHLRIMLLPKRPIARVFFAFVSQKLARCVRNDVTTCSPSIDCSDGIIESQTLFRFSRRGIITRPSRNLRSPCKCFKCSHAMCRQLAPLQNYVLMFVIRRKWAGRSTSPPDLVVLPKIRVEVLVPVVRFAFALRAKVCPVTCMFL